MIAIIVEGENYEKGIINNIQKVFFHLSDKETVQKIITLPAGMNIYMLWKRMIADDCEVDIIELVRELCEASRLQLYGFERNDFSEVYLFFDFDAHQKNLPDTENPFDVIFQMLRTFDNETENGKLYISYPMAEALRDFSGEGCKTSSGNCYIPYNIDNYKQLSGMNNPNAAVKRYKKTDWIKVLKCYKKRLSCLFDGTHDLLISELKEFTPEMIYNRQKAIIDKDQKIIILSAFPEYIIDYFKEDYLETYFIENKSEIAMQVPKCDRGMFRLS